MDEHQQRSYQTSANQQVAIEHAAMWMPWQGGIKVIPRPRFVNFLTLIIHTAPATAPKPQRPPGSARVCPKICELFALTRVDWQELSLQGGPTAAAARTATAVRLIIVISLSQPHSFGQLAATARPTARIDATAVRCSSSGPNP